MTVLLFLCAALPALAQETGNRWLGVSLRDVTAAEADALGWDESHGARVLAVVRGSPADVAGVLRGDVLVLLDGVEVANAGSFDEILAKKAAASRLRLTVRRGARQKRLTVNDTAPRPAQATAAAKSQEPEAHGAAPPTSKLPQLVLDPGGHVSRINGIAFTADGRRLVTASSDKTIRIWDIASARTVRTIRGEIGPGRAGGVLAIALSPNGKWLAAGGWMQVPGEPGYHIRLYDFATGRLAALLKGHDQPVHSLAFSPDGGQLISGSEDSTAIIWEVATGNIKRRLRGHGKAISGAAFTADGRRVVTASLDHDLRLWQVADGKEIARMQGHGGKVISLAVAPDGTVASGDEGGTIRLWDGRTGAFRKELVKQPASVRCLIFTPDSALLLASTGVNQNHAANTVYDIASGRGTVTYRGHGNAVTAAAVSPNGQWVATAGGGDREVHIWNIKTGGRAIGDAGQPLTVGGTAAPVGAVAFSADGRRIAWGYSRPWHAGGQSLPQYALTLASLETGASDPRVLDSAAAAAFTGMTAEHNGWSLKARDDGARRNAVLDIVHDGQTAASIGHSPAGGRAHLSYTFTPDGETVISGGHDGVLAAYSLGGSKRGTFLGHNGDVLAVAASPDGRYLLSGGEDGTVRLWNLKTRALLATLFRRRDGEWAMWTPGGYYAGSGAGGTLFGWHVNRGAANAAEFTAAGQLRRSLNRPDAVARTIALGAEEDALRALAVRGFQPEKLGTQPAPRFLVLAPADGVAVNTGGAALRLLLEATPDPIRELRVRVNGRMIVSVPPNAGKAFAAGPLTVKAELAEGHNEVTIIAASDIGETAKTLTVFHHGPGDLDKRGTLYVLAIGVDQYPGLKGGCATLAAAPDCDLRFAGSDAAAFAQAVEAGMGPRHRKVVHRVLTRGKKADGTPDRLAILSAFEMLQAAKPNDTVVVYLAGRALSEGLNYRFLPADTALENGRLAPASVMSWFEIREALANARGRRILFLDTFRSGNAFNPRLDSDVYYAGIIAYTAAHGDEQAVENEKTGHGLFAAALIAGLNGAADRNQDKHIRADELGDFVRQTVMEHAAALHRAQEPRMYLGGDDGNVLLLRLK